jgi:hypothetical protein
VTLAGDFFEQREINDDMGIDSAEMLWRWVRRGASRPMSGQQKAIPSCARVVYRGQATATYGLSSSLYRLCRSEKGGPVAEADLRAAETAIIKAMRGEGIGRLMTDGELLMVLQHHLIPTRLIDVSIQRTEALFFAVDRNDAADGRLFIIDVRTPDPLPLTPGPQLPWADVVWGSIRSTSEWSNAVAFTDADPLDPRMRAQRGKFLVGGLNRRHTG